VVETGGTSPGLLLGALIFLIVLAVAIFVATLAYFGRAQSKKQAERERPAPPTPPRARGEPASRALRAEQAAPAALQETPARPGEVMRVIRDERTGRVLVEVEGRQYAHIREIEDAQVGRRVLWAIADLLRFTGGMAANPQAVRSVVQQVAQDAGIADGVETPASPPAAPLPVVPSTSAISSRYSLVDFFRRGFESPQTTPPPGSRSFIDEIEAILQVHVQRRPTPLPYEVHVATGPDNRLQIRVGLDVYGSPDEVPDLGVRELIRAAVDEWERR
jgi:pyruvate/2-oxoglutarate dehydrogenase complex dihydrolipoamide acyltransferase (E2) component